MSLDYSVAIRTLGKAGEKYQKTLDSLLKQTILPQKIVVYIAEGYTIPQETIGIEEYVYVSKGMLAQRALDYKEISSEYILFLDDDVYIPSRGVEDLYYELITNGGDVISPDVFKHSNSTVANRIVMSLSGRMTSRNKDTVWGYKINRNGGFSFNLSPSEVMCSQSNAGPCFLCKKSSFLSIKYDEEAWLDNMLYSLGDDQVMYYKMYLSGLVVLTSYDSEIVHLDAASTTKNMEKEKLLAYSDAFFKTVFCHRFIYLPEDNPIERFWDRLTFYSTALSNLVVSLVKCRRQILNNKYRGYRDGIEYLKSPSYNSLPRIQRQNAH